MRKNVFFFTVTLVITFLSKPINAASFSSLKDYVDEPYTIYDAIISDDTTAVIIPYGCGYSMLWKSGTISYLPYLWYTGMTSDGSVLVGTNSSQAFKYESGIITYLGAGEAYAISYNGHIITGKDSDDYDAGQACVWIDGVKEVIGIFEGHDYSYGSAISGNGKVIGRSIDLDPSIELPFIWSNGVMEQLPNPAGASKWWPEAISLDGSVVVGSFPGSQYTEACMYSNGTTVGLGIPQGYTASCAYDVSADGSLIVGNVAFFETEGIYTYHVPRAAIWDELHGMRVLQDVLEDDFGLDLTGWTLENALGISADGTMIYGDGISPGGYSGAYWIAEIPEPGTVILLGFGAVILRRSKRRSNLPR